MGCDIHLHVETRNPETGKWKYKQPHLRTCCSCHGTGKRPVDARLSSAQGDSCFWCSGRGQDRTAYYSGRNYGLFAILANVRNGYGFAGIRTGDGYNPISEPRGLPASISAKVLKEADNWGVDGHSHSHLTLAELLAYDWEQTTVNEGVVSGTVYQQWVEKGRKGSPREWCGSVSGGDIEQVSNLKMDQLMATGEHLIQGRFESKYYTRIEWEETYRSVANEFINDTLVELQEIAKKVGGPDNVRIVFWFDN